MRPPHQSRVASRRRIATATTTTTSRHMTTEGEHLLSKGARTSHRRCVSRACAYFNSHSREPGVAGVESKSCSSSNFSLYEARVMQLAYTNPRSCIAVVGGPRFLRQRNRCAFATQQAWFPRGRGAHGQVSGSSDPSAKREPITPQ
jgi:hypothetical protein